jgi:vacuolar protein sorting-associated protein 13A/C
MQISDAWLLYKSDTLGEGFLSATLKVLTVIDDREGTEQEFKLVIGKLESVGSSPLHTVTYDENQHIVGVPVFGENEIKPVPTMLILDAKFSKLSTVVSLCVQRPQMLVALDFLLAMVEFFVPSAVKSNEEDKNSKHVIDAIILDQSTFRQPSAEFSLSPQRPLIVDDERFDHFIYDGNGGVLFLKDREGYNLVASSTEAIIYVGSGKKLQFKNVVIKVLNFTYIIFFFYGPFEYRQ